MAFWTWSSLIPQISVNPFKLLCKTSRLQLSIDAAKWEFAIFFQHWLTLRDFPVHPLLLFTTAHSSSANGGSEKQSKPLVPLCLTIAGLNTSRSLGALRVLMRRFYLKLSRGIWLKKTENNRSTAWHQVTDGSEADLLTVVDTCSSIFVIVEV